MALSVRWVDAAGQVAGYGDTLAHRDGDGHWWYVDWATGQVDQDKQKLFPAAAVFEDPDCLGVKYYVKNVGFGGETPNLGPPLVPFWVSNETTWRARQPGTQVVTINIRGTSTLGFGCGSANQPNALVILASSTAPATLPTLPTSGPLHREVLQ